MLRTIYEQFNKCGVTELLFEVGLGKKGTIKRNVKGGDIKEGILLHNNFLQALLRHITDNQPLHKLQTVITHEIIHSMIHYCRHKMLPTLYRAMAAFMNIYLEMVNMLLNCFCIFCVLQIGRVISEQFANFFHTVSVLIDIIMRKVCYTTIFICYC